jgi:hypothetical protein
MEVESVRKIHSGFEAVSNRNKYEDKTSLVLPHSYFGEDWCESVKKMTI